MKNSVYIDEIAEELNLDPKEMWVDTMRLTGAVIEFVQSNNDHIRFSKTIRSWIRHPSGSCYVCNGSMTGLAGVTANGYLISRWDISLNHCEEVKDFVKVAPVSDPTYSRYAIWEKSVSEAHGNVDQLESWQLLKSELKLFLKSNKESIKDYEIHFHYRQSQHIHALFSKNDPHWSVFGFIGKWTTLELDIGHTLTQAMLSMSGRRGKEGHWKVSNPFELPLPLKYSYKKLSKRGKALLVSSIICQCFGLYYDGLEDSEHETLSMWTWKFVQLIRQSELYLNVRADVKQDMLSMSVKQFERFYKTAWYLPPSNLKLYRTFKDVDYIEVANNNPIFKALKQSKEENSTS